MKQKKFRSLRAAQKFAQGMKVKKGKACKLADGTKANWYSFKKKAKK